MEQSPKKHLSLWISWAIVALMAGIASFCIWYYFDQVSTIYDNIVTTGSVKKTTKPTATTTTVSAADWKTYTNDTYKFSIKYPIDLTYELSNNEKIIAFQNSQDKTQFDNCVKNKTSECIKSSQMVVAIDELVGTPNGDNLSLSLDQIIQNRVSNMQLAKNPMKITLADQPAYEAIAIGMFSSYVVISKNNNHIYDLRIVQNCTGVTVDTCKAEETDVQKTMLSTFQFSS